jgi:DNA helicase II / ATP-dependent DNA helicase PcrA
MKGLTLNPKQQEAASHMDGPMAVLSVAGSGKTMVLTERIIQLIENHNVDASSILAITFAKKAVLEIIGRLETKLNGNSGRVHVSTFHSLGYRILKKTGYPTTGFRLVYDEEQLRLFIEAVSKAKIHEEPLDLLKRVSLAKNDLVTAQELKDAKKTSEKSLAKVLMEYEMLKRRRRVVDFDDLLCLPHRLLSQDDGLLHYYQDRFRYVLVDEFQDSSKVMVELVKLLSSNHQNVWVAGDDDQSIHGFRGARADTFIEFEKHCNGSLRTVAMNQNYRSSGNIIAMANKLISRNKSRVEKEMETDRDAGEDVQIIELFDETKEAEFIADSVGDLKKRKFKSLILDLGFMRLAKND